MLKVVFAAAAVLLAQPARAQFKTVTQPGEAPAYAAKDYPAVTQGVPFSYTAGALHVKLYQGYVKNVNLLLQRFKELEAEGKTSSPEYAELKRRFGWEFNGMRLHELFFAELGASPLPDGSPLKAALAAQYGSFDAWKAGFLALVPTRGIGWAALVYDQAGGRFHNVWINEHDGGVPAGAQVLLVLDLFEHAYLPDYQLDRARYAQAFWGAVNWGEVARRFSK